MLWMNITKYEKAVTPHRKKCPHVVHLNVSSDWFETNLRHQKCYSEDGKKFCGCCGLLERVIAERKSLDVPYVHTLMCIVLMTQKLCTVGMCNAIPTNHLNVFHIQSWSCKKASPKYCTLFPDRVLPVKSSLLINNENCVGRFGMFHGWIGVFLCASYKTAIPKLRSKYLSSVTCRLILHTD